MNGQTFTRSLLALTALAPFPPANAAPESQTACISVQGNGARFMALLGQLVALLESDVIPVVSEGGSSAALVVPLMQGALANPSVQHSPVFQNDGTPLSVPQKAALLLSAAPAAAQTLLFLPSLNRGAATFGDALLYTTAWEWGRAFFGGPTNYISQTEFTAGQGLLLIDFFANSDFSNFFKLQSQVERNRHLLQMWTAFADTILVSPSEFIRALVTSPQSPRTTPRGEEIKRRYFALYRSEIERTGESPEDALVRYNKVLATFAPIVDTLPDQALEGPFQQILKLMRNLPFVGYVATVTMKPFHIPAPERIWNAFRGRARSGADLVSPPGTLIHTTARIADISSNNTFAERLGIENFYQVYFPSSDLHAPLSIAQQQLGNARGFLEHPAVGGGWTPVIPASNTLVLQRNLLAQALTPSIAEPGVFRRFPIPLSSGERAQFLPDQRQALITYGGWMAHVDTPTLQRIPACQQADFMINVSTLSRGLWRFQEYAIRPVIKGNWGALEELLPGRRPSPENDPVARWMNGLWRSFQYGKSLTGKLGKISLNFDWDNPSGLSDEAAKKMNYAYDDDTTTYFLRSYQDAVMHLQRTPNLRHKTGITEVRENLMRTDLTQAQSPEELLSLTRNIVSPRN